MRIGVSPSSLLELFSAPLLLDDSDVLELLAKLLELLARLLEEETAAFELLLLLVLLLDVATTLKLPQEMAGLRVTLVLPQVTSPKVMVLVPAL